jgi:hypothetical protein
VCVEAKETARQVSPAGLFHLCRLFLRLVAFVAKKALLPDVSA